MSDYGKIPPQATELEEMVLGAVMLEKHAINVVASILTKEALYKTQHQHIYSAMLSLHRKGNPIDILTVIEQLKKDGKIGEAGGMIYLTEITNRVASAANVEQHSYILLQKHIQREMIRIGGQITQEAYEDITDVFELMDGKISELLKIRVNLGVKKSKTLYDAAKEFTKELLETVNSGKDFNGIPYGITALDRFTGGFQNTDLVIMAARPSMGKSTLALQITINAASLGYAVGFFSLEMGSKQLAAKVIGNKAQIDLHKLRTPQKLQEYELSQIGNKVAELDIPVHIDDTAGLSIIQFRAKATQMKLEHDIKMIVVDYLQLMAGSGKKGMSREQEISEISRGLKLVAKELEIPVIALSQLSRAVETRGGDKRPQLSDLRESGAIEQDADVVMFLYRPEYYGINEYEDGNSTAGLAEIIYAKHRNGSLGTVKTLFNGKFSMFTDMDEQIIPLDEPKALSEPKPIRRSWADDNNDDIPF